MKGKGIEIPQILGFKQFERPTAFTSTTNYILDIFSGKVPSSHSPMEKDWI